MKAWSAIGKQGPPTLAYTCEFVYMYSMLAKMLRINTLLAAAALAASLLWPALSRAAELVMFEQGGCVWCARWNREVGPVYDKTAEAKLFEKVKKGGVGVWGQIPMPPNAAVPDADIKALVKWILSQK